MKRLAFFAPLVLVCALAFAAPPRSRADGPSDGANTQPTPEATPGPGSQGPSDGANASSTGTEADWLAALVALIDLGLTIVP